MEGRWRAYVWGRNEYPHLGSLYSLSSSSEGVEGESTNNNAMIPFPCPLTGPFVTDSIPIVGATTRTGHTILINVGGAVYACILNKMGQCGINHAIEEVRNFKRCSIVGGRGGGGGGRGGRGKGKVGG